MKEYEQTERDQKVDNIIVKGMAALAVGSVIAGGAYVAEQNNEQPPIENPTNYEQIKNDLIGESAEQLSPESTAILTELPPVAYEDSKANYVIDQH